MTPNEAREIGRQARQQGHGPASALNSKIMAEIEKSTGPFGTTYRMGILKAFNKGWHEENLKAGE